MQSKTLLLTLTLLISSLAFTPAAQAQDGRIIEEVYETLQECTESSEAEDCVEMACQYVMDTNSVTERVTCNFELLSYECMQTRDPVQCNYDTAIRIVNHAYNIVERKIGGTGIGDPGETLTNTTGFVIGVALGAYDTAMNATNETLGTVLGLLGDAPDQVYQVWVDYVYPAGETVGNETHNGMNTVRDNDDAVEDLAYEHGPMVADLVFGIINDPGSVYPGTPPVGQQGDPVYVTGTDSTTPPCVFAVNALWCSPLWLDDL